MGSRVCCNGRSKRHSHRIGASSVNSRFAAPIAFAVDTSEPSDPKCLLTHLRLKPSSWREQRPTSVTRNRFAGDRQARTHEHVRTCFVQQSPSSQPTPARMRLSKLTGLVRTVQEVIFALHRIAAPRMQRRQRKSGAARPSVTTNRAVLVASTSAEEQAWDAAVL
jgi:hypothetical protein